MTYPTLRVAIQNIVDSGGTYADIISYVIGLAAMDVTGERPVAVVLPEAYSLRRDAVTC